MLTNEILQALKGYAANMQKKVTFVLQAGTHDKRDELVNRFKDERPHCALSLGARSGPLLRAEAYTARMVDKQLHEDAVRFVNDERRNIIIPDKKRVAISMIFKWDAKDFIPNFGTIETFRRWSIEDMAVMGFISFYVADEEKAVFLEAGNYKIRYLDFDWKLNKWFPEMSEGTLRESG
jgi:hypothetical protein